MMDMDKEQWNGAPGPMEAEPPGGSAEAPERLSRFRYAAAAAAKGAVVGGTMLIPGVSGGTTAIILGIYDQLVRAVSGFRAHKRESLRLLFWFCLGACGGILLLARPLLGLLERFPLPTGCFFLGAVAGSVPAVYRKSRIQHFQWRVPVYVLLGAALVLALNRLPVPAHEAAAGGGGGFLLLLLAGALSAAALVLPGISVSYLLLLLGLYDGTMTAIARLDLAFLFPLALGLLAGIFLFTRALDLLMTRYPRATYLVILGFMLASLPTLLPGLPGAAEWLPCLLSLLAGFLIIHRVSRL